MALSEEEQEELIFESWKLLGDVIFDGKLKLRSGKSQEASVREILGVAQFLASKRPPKVRKVPNLDMKLERTDGEEA